MYYVLLYEIESGKQLKLACRLTEAHIYPSNFQKQSVPLVVRLFSKRNSVSFRKYREMVATTPEEKRIKALFQGTIHL